MCPFLAQKTCFGHFARRRFEAKKELGEPVSVQEGIGLILCGKWLILRVSPAGKPSGEGLERVKKSD